MSIHEFGLVCYHDEMLAAFSPDGIAGVVEDLEWASLRYPALVEMKSKCTDATLLAEKELVEEFGELVSVGGRELLLQYYVMSGT